MRLPESVTGIIFSPDRTGVLLTQRRDVPVWVLPGGGLEVGEAPQEGVAREILEETGFIVKVDRLVGTYTPINRLARFTYLYECSIIGGEAKLSSETRGVDFFPLTALPKAIPPPYSEWIADALVQRAPVHKPLQGVTYLILLKNLLLHPILVFRFLLSRCGLPINSGKEK